MTGRMDVFAVVEIARAMWLYVAGPLLALSAIVLTIRLRGPQFRRIGAGFRALRAKGDGDGELSPGLALSLSAAGQFGAAAAVGAGTGIALGGPGVIPYLWAFALLMAPLRYAETLFAGTDAPGGGDASQSGSIARRLMRLGGPWKKLGALMVLLAMVASFAFGGVLQSEALANAASPLLPGSSMILVLSAATVGALLAAAGKRTASILGWLGAFGLLVLVGASLWAIGSAPGAAFASLGAAFSSAFEGAPRFEAFGGAFAGEVAFAALLYVLPPAAAPTGADGAIQASSTGGIRAQAAASQLGPLAFALVSTLLCMGLVGTGAYGHPVEARIALPEATVFKVPANTLTERVDEERLFSGYMRIRAGQARNPATSYGSGRGMIQDAVVLYNGRAADLALHVDGGKAFRILRNISGSTLGEVSKSNLWRVEIQGQMAPRGGDLLIAAANEGGSDLLARLLLAALLALGAAAFALWGLAAARALPAGAPAAASILACFLPLAGAALALGVAPPGLKSLALIGTAAFVALSALVLLVRSKEISAIDR